MVLTSSPSEDPGPASTRGSKGSGVRNDDEVFSLGEFYKQAKTNQASIVLLRANNSNSSHRIPCSVAAGLFLLLDSIRIQ
jgi:hypothetical protein